MKAAKVLSIGNHRGNMRLWIDGEAPRAAGFEPDARYEVKPHGNGVVLEIVEGGKRKVSAKENAKGVKPVIDINNTELLKPLEGCEAVRVLFGDKKIFISPLASELRRLKRLKRTKAKLEAGEALSTGGLCSGGGILSYAVHQGMEEAGVQVEQHFFNEIREDLIEHAQAANEIITDKTIIVNMGLQEAGFDMKLGDFLGEVDILEVGLPCSGASVAGKSKNKNAMMEEHEHVGHLVVAALAMIAKVNPTVIVFENVVPYSSTASAELLRKQLKDFGYVTHETVLDAEDFDTLERRVRWTMVAVTKGIDFDLTKIEKLGKTTRKLKEVLEPMEAVEDRWSEMTGLKAKQERDIAAGKGFMMQVFTGEEDHIKTLTKGISKNRSTDPKIQHPHNPDLLRIPTAREHARCKGIPEHLIEGLSQTTAHELLGQSICFNPFKQLAKLVGQSLNAWAVSGKIEISAISFACTA